MTILAPRLLRAATIELLSNALSPSSAPKSTPSIRGSTPTVSKRCPGNKTKRTRLPSASVRARILVVIPPLDLPIASPFCALSVTVDLDDRGIDHGILHVRLIVSLRRRPPCWVSLSDV